MSSKIDQPTVGMLLDIDNYNGSHSGRLGPWIATLSALAVPAVLYAYFNLQMLIPIFVALPIYIVFAIRVLLIIPGREKQRLAIFKKTLDDDYTQIASKIQIKSIHPDGCVEYTDGSIHYFVVTYNNTIEDDGQHAVDLAKFLSMLVEGRDFNVYIMNNIDAPALSAYYDKVHAFGHNDAAMDFVRIIDHMKDLVSGTSLLQMTVYDIKGYRSEWKDIAKQVDSAVASADKLFKYVYRIKDSEKINAIINRDIDSVVFIDDLLRMKYKTGNFSTSRVLAWDVVDEDISIGNAVQKTATTVPSETFHVKFEN